MFDSVNHHDLLFLLPDVVDGVRSEDVVMASSVSLSFAGSA